MSFGTGYYDWQANPDGLRPEDYNRCSPNLLTIMGELEARWGLLVHLGCRVVNTIPLTDLQSTHSYGAAIDLGYGAGVDNRVRADQMIGFLVGWSGELGVSAIHDYTASRIWHARRTPRSTEACTAWWKAQRRVAGQPMGQSWATWIHVETTPDEWGNDLPTAERGVY